MRKSLPILIALLVASTAPATVAAPLTEIVVTAELLQDPLLESSNSISVVDAQAIERRSARHLEDLLNLAPNVNYASGASRGRFVQIRGIGERSEFQEPIINSVGVLLDGIDLTGIATAASTLDIRQVEVLRGPQGTLHGANALAGLINIVSNAPTDTLSRRLQIAAEEYGGQQLSGMISGPLGERTAYRLAVSNYASDGFTENVFLGRDDTNNIDETTARLRLRSEVSDDLQIDVSLFVADIDNGYDAFSLDNTRQTYSDQPGVDRQDTKAASLTATYQLQPSLNVQAVLAHADSDLQYSYDEDWSHADICDATACDTALFGFDWFYISSDDYRRANQNTSLDLRLASASDSLAWVAGMYLREQSIDLQRIYTFAESDFASELDARNLALYGQLDWGLSSHWTVSAGLRLEQRQLDYVDNSGGRANPDEDLWGGRLALEYRADSGAFYYALISRGYKAGGFNLDGSIAATQREFDTESMLNYELGIKNTALDGALQISAALFLQDRADIQTKQSIVASIGSGEIGGACPCSFTDFTDNAASGRNAGVEAELRWQASDRLELAAAVGLLDTRFDDYSSFEHVNADPDNGLPFNLSGREQAHAPGYQFFLSAQYRIGPHWQVSGSVEGKDAFFFSDRHDARSDAYQLLNLQLAWLDDNWGVALYAKNLTDELVTTRGFGSFGNDPRKFYATEPYNQFAAPRVIGVKANLEF